MARNLGMDHSLLEHWKNQAEKKEPEDFPGSSHHTRDGLHDRDMHIIGIHRITHL